MAIIPLALRSAKLFRLLPALSALFVLVGIAWLLVLPLDDYSRRTYISENALLPGSVHTYFAGSEQNVFQAYREEVKALGRDASSDDIVARIGDIFKGQGLKVGVQKYKYTASGKDYEGKNVYAVLEAPRGDATESMVLVAGWRNMDDVLNESGVALVLALARYFKRWSLWSKDVIFLITSDSRAGPQAWVDAYHDMQPQNVSPLPVKSGAIQSVVVLDYPTSSSFDSIHILYDGINGQLPNLDLFNTAVSIAGKQMDIHTTLQEMYSHNDGYSSRLHTMLRGMVNQGLGHATGPHSSFIPYHIDAITLQVSGHGYHDEVSMGRLLESLFRSLNNLLEHFHQSFFFYLLLGARRFVSIGTYLPSAMLLASSFTLSAIRLWVQSGRTTTTITPACETPQRALLLPTVFTLLLHLLGAIPLYLFNTTTSTSLTTTFTNFTLLTLLLPIAISYLLHTLLHPTQHQLTLISCISLLLLGLFLAALATLNFSLSFLIAVFAVPYPLAHAAAGRGKCASAFWVLLLQVVAPTMALVGVAKYWGEEVGLILEEAAFGWVVWRMWTQVVVWCVWWPAWVCAGVMACSGWWGKVVEKKMEEVEVREEKEEKKERKEKEL
ncbi:Glycosylphosphatidylinositol:protein transamidase, GAA1 component [Ascodesmis nigricans]|uniref:Glycosylphosphatidylinositol:protein transamidase, GAA1 component n=1 Tax=Ascodesmis nigricans TaxID=341454 RepID=A0A4S2N785_9PEZI|nr:Glycosylphosphatidylinositol:protein transamidase, GAA1 component [Ascodesmis nigricans]